MSARVFVAGATGVLGRRVVPALVGAGYSVTANVRNPAAARVVEAVGARPTTVDLFAPQAAGDVGASHDVIVNIATAIPAGARALRASAWTMNDRLRTEAAANLAAAASSAGRRYVGESITFPYLDCGDAWIDEGVERTFFSGNASSAEAESAAQSVTSSGGVGVTLRFALFFADDSAHVDTYRSLARRGLFGLTGRPDARVSFVHVDDAARAVVAALDVPPGVYNVAEPDPVTRVAHAEAMARAVGRKRLRGFPPSALRVGGAALESVSRSHRVSSEPLISVSDWEPRIPVVDMWC